MAKQPSKREENRKFWKTHVQDWEASSLTQAEYCRQNNLKLKSFTYRKGRMTREKEEVVSFLPVTVQPESCYTVETDSLLRLVLGNGLKIEVADGFNPATLRELVQTVGVL